MRPKSKFCKKLINPAAIIADFINTTEYPIDTNLIYTDASYNPANGNSNEGILKLRSNYQFSYFGTKLNKLYMNTVSLAEIATIVEGLNSLQDSNDAIVFTDSQTAVDSHAAWISGHKSYDKIEKAYLWSQIKSKERNVEVVKVKGHDKDKLNNFVDRVADLHWNYPQTKLK